MANEDMFDEQKIKLRPIERIGALIDTEKFKEEITAFERFEVNKGNAPFFRQLINARKENNLNFMQDKLERMYRILEAHPQFGQYFKKPLEMQQKRKDDLANIRPYGMLKTDLIDDQGKIIQELQGFIAMLWHYVELDEILSKKLEEVIVGGESKPVESHMKAERQQIPWGATKGDKAYLMASIEGKSQPEIAKALNIEVKQVSQYIKLGYQRGVRLGVISEVDEKTNTEKDLEDV